MYIPLRIHSVYSKGKGAASLEELASWLALRKYPRAALTDLENLYGWGRWKRVARGRDFFPLFGCELEIRGRRFVFLVKSREGYWNLMDILNRREISDTLAYLRVIVNPADQVALLRIINTPTRGIGKMTIQRLVATAEHRGCQRTGGRGRDQPRPGLRPPARGAQLAFRLALSEARPPPGWGTWVDAAADPGCPGCGCIGALRRGAERRTCRRD